MGLDSSLTPELTPAPAHGADMATHVSVSAQPSQLKLVK